MQDVTALLNAGIRAAQAGKNAQAKPLLVQVVAHDPQNEAAWLWLSRVLPTVDQRLKCLDHLLAINPNNQAAQEANEVLKLQQLLSDVTLFSESATASCIPSKRLGELLVEQGVLTAAELETALGELAQAAKAGNRIQLGELLLRGHGLRREHLARALEAQIVADQLPREDRRMPSLGHFLVHQGALSVDQLADALAIQSGQPGNWPQIGALLIKLGYITPAQLADALSTQYHQYNGSFM